jgi:transposase-like protein
MGARMAIEFWAELRAALAGAGADPDVIDRACAGVAVRLGGARHYIPKRWREPEVGQQDTPATLARREGISPRSAYRWVDRWRAGRGPV